MRFARTALRVVAVAVIAVSGLLLAGCTGSASTPSSSAPEASARSATPPTLKLVVPSEGAEVPAGDVTMAVEATGLKFVMPSNTNVAGEGHVHFTLDDQPFKMSTSPEYVMKDVAAGPHRLRAELVQNDTKSFDPPLVQEISFTVR